MRTPIENRSSLKHLPFSGKKEVVISLMGKRSLRDNSKVY